MSDQSLWQRANEIPSLDLPFASTKSLVDIISGKNLINFTRASTGTYVDANGVIRTAAVNEARFDHDPTTGESLGLLVEEERTNLLVRSEEFDNASWVKSNSTITANAAIAPDGTTTASKLIESNGATRGMVSQMKAAANGDTISVFAKAAEWTNVAVGTTNGSGIWGLATFNLTAGTVVGNSSFGGAQVGSPVIVAVGNGWYRCSVQIVVNGGSVICIMPFNQSGDPVNPIPSLVGNGTSGIYIWGAQLEVGAFPTSYIPTTTAQATRSADVAKITGTNFSSWFNSSQLTLLADYRVRHYPAGVGYDAGIWGFGAVAPRIYLTQRSNASRPIQVQVYDGTNSIGANSGVFGDLIVGSSVKVAFSLSGSSGSITHDGLAVKPTNVSTVNISGITQSTIGDRPDTASKLNSTISRLTYWPTRLSNATLQQITEENSMSCSCYNPKTSSVTVEYIGNKLNNVFYWTEQFPWVPAYEGGQTITELSPKGVIKYTDGTSPTAPAQ